MKPTTPVAKISIICYFPHHHKLFHFIRAKNSFSLLETCKYHSFIKKPPDGNLITGDSNSHCLELQKNHPTWRILVYILLIEWFKHVSMHRQLGCSQAGLILRLFLQCRTQAEVSGAGFGSCCQRELCMEELLWWESSSSAKAAPSLWAYFTHYSLL